MYKIILLSTIFPENGFRDQIKEKDEGYINIGRDLEAYLRPLLLLGGNYTMCTTAHYKKFQLFIFF